jgi:cell division protein FtsB
MRSLWKKLGWLAVFSMLAVYIVLVSTGPRGLPALRQKQQQIFEMRQHVADLVRENERRRERIRLLQEDREEQELRIRERLRLRKPGTADLYYPETPGPAESPKP